MAKCTHQPSPAPGKRILASGLLTPHRVLSPTITLAIEAIALVTPAITLATEAITLASQLALLQSESSLKRATATIAHATATHTPLSQVTCFEMEASGPDRIPATSFMESITTPQTRVFRSARLPALSSRLLHQSTFAAN